MQPRTNTFDGSDKQNLKLVNGLQAGLDLQTCKSLFLTTTFERVSVR